MASKVPAVKPMSTVDIERVSAKAMRKIKAIASGRDGAINILQLFERLDEFDSKLQPGVDELPLGVLGQVTPDGHVLLSETTYRELLADDPRARFTTAHECGHAILHFDQVRARFTEGSRGRLYRRADIPAYRDPEWQANAFAAATLMPRPAMRRLAHRKPSDLVQEVARFFNVSRESASIRVRKLAL